MRFPTRLVAPALLVLSACGGGGKQDDCQRFADKIWPTLTKMAAADGGKPMPSKASMVEKCRVASKRDPMMDCVLAAKDQAGADTCVQKAFGAYLDKSKAIEVKLQANRLSKSAKYAYIERAAYPVASTGWVPAAACCGQPDQKCAPTPTEWQAEPWTALDFALDEPSRVRVKYEGTALAFTATAWADLDCDDAQDDDEVVVVRGSQKDGTPVTELEPAR